MNETVETFRRKLSQFARGKASRSVISICSLAQMLRARAPSSKRLIWHEGIRLREFKTPFSPDPTVEWHCCRRNLLPRGWPPRNFGWLEFFPDLKPSIIFNSVVATGCFP